MTEHNKNANVRVCVCWYVCRDAVGNVLLVCVLGKGRSQISLKLMQES